MSTTAAEGPDGYGIYTNIDGGVFARLGSPDGTSTLRMLIGHKEQIKYRTVERIVVFGCRDIEDIEDDTKSRTYSCFIRPSRTIMKGVICLNQLSPVVRLDVTRTDCICGCIVFTYRQKAFSLRLIFSSDW